MSNNYKALYILILLGCLGLAVFTGTKLFSMAQIRGWLPGATVTQYPVTQKYIEENPRRGPDYWVSWTSQPVTQPGNHRVNIQAEEYNTLRIGGPISIVRVGNDATPYVRDSIFDSYGNFAFDVVLLVAELVGIIAMIVLLVRPARPIRSQPRYTPQL